MKRSLKVLICAVAIASSLYLAAHISASVSQVPAGTWRLSNPMAQTRSGASTAFLVDGRLMVAGGTGASGPLSEVELFGGAGTFSVAPSMNFARSGHASVVLPDGRVLVAGGMGADGRATDTAEIFDVLTQAWTVTGPLMVPRSGATASLLRDGRVLVAGGVNAAGATNTFELFDPASATFTLGIGVLSSPRESHAAAVLPDGRVLIVGGNDGSRALATSDIYDPETNSVVAGPALSTPRQLVSATTQLDGRVFIAGGNNGKIDLDTAEIFDPSSGVFSPAAGNLATPRSGHLAFLLPDNHGVLMVGGSSNGEVLSSSEVYYPWAGTFSSSGALAFGRAGATGAPLGQDGLLLVAGGKDASGNSLSSTELYGFATLKTDKLDYAPHETVTITGTGWEPGETVQLILHEDPALHGDRRLKATADGGGNIVNTKFTPDPHDEGIRFYLTGTGAASQAQITFTDKISTTTTVTSSVNPSAVGQAVTFVATVTRNTSGNGTPSRTVQFVIDGANYGLPVTLAPCSGQSACASITISTLTSGTHTIEADYSSDVNFLSSSGTLPGGQTVLKASSSTNLVSSLNPSTFGQPVTFTATVDTVPAGAGIPAGTVTFNDGATALGTVALNASGVSTLSTSSLSVGSHSITAVYNGSSGLSGSVSPVLTQVISQGTTSTALVSSVNPSVVGQPVTFTATVSVLSPSTGTASGTVTFKDGTTTLGTGTLTAVGYATFSTSSLTLGAHSITAVYGGNTTYTSSTSAVLTQTVTAEKPTSTVVSSAPNPSLPGQPVTFTATVSVVAPNTGTPTGTVTFKDGTTVLGTGTLNALGFTTLSTTSLAIGAHSITATYSGDALFAGSTSAAITQTVNKGSTSAALATSASPTLVGQPVTFTATISVLAPSIGMARGTVTFKDGTTALGTGTLNSLGYTTFSTSSLTLGSHSITAVYSGGPSFNGSTSAPLTQTVNQGSTGIVAASSVNPSVVGQPVTFTGTVSVVAPATGIPTGTVTFKDGTTILGSGTLNTLGFATFSTSALTLGTHSITTVYSGDANFKASTSAGLTQTVTSQKQTTTAVVSSVNPSLSGQPVTFTATVSVVAPNTGTPTGTVTFKDGATTLGTGTLNSSGFATFNTSGLAVGGHSISAVYSGDTFFTGSTSAALTQTVNKGATGIVVATSITPSLVGQPVTFTATVSVTAPATGVATGTVTFKDGTTTLGTGTLNALGYTTLSTSSLALGAHSITAVYGGSASFTGITSAAIAQTVNQGATTTVLSSSANPSVVGQPVTLTATVMVSAPASGTASGTVTFKDGVTTLGTGTLNASGFTTLSTSGLALGVHSLTAVYGGSTNFTGSTSSLLSQTVNQGTTATALASSYNPAAAGLAVTFTATVSPAAPGTGTATGNVTFKDGTTVLATSALNAQGFALYTTSSLALGTHTITAIYAGDSNFTGSTSAALSQSVIASKPTSVAVVSNFNPSVIGQPLTFTATVTVVPPGTGTPTGTVTFKDGAATLGTSALSATGFATFNTSSLVVGAHSISATYSGDAFFTAATSPVVTQTVNKGSVSAVVTPTVNPSVIGQSVTFTGTVSVLSPAFGTPTGTLTFKDGATTLGTGTLNASGFATFTTSSMAVGAHSITAVYSGDGNFKAATSPVLSQTVNRGATSTALASSLNPSTFGQSVTFTATVTVIAPAIGTPKALVNFYDGTVLLGTGTLNNAGWTTLTTSTLSVGSHTITAVYTGGTNFAPSTSAPVTQNVN